MRAFSRLTLLLIALFATGASAQIVIPQIIQLPSDDFVWTWGRNSSSSFEQRDRPEFTIFGVERDFQCTLTGAFRLGSRMRDFYAMREFEQSLAGSLYFIQEATARLNYYTQSNDIGWATLDCAVPDGEVSEDKAQERLDRAVERAERQRERRRSREGTDDE
jgi:hypothetical protein